MALGLGSATDDRIGFQARKQFPSSPGFFLGFSGFGPAAGIVVAPNAPAEHLLAVLEWVFPQIQPRSIVQTQMETSGELICKGMTRIVDVSGREPNSISIPIA